MKWKKQDGGALKPVTQRFTIGGTGDSSKAVEERLKEVATTPPEELLRSSEWRRKLPSSEQGNKPEQPTSSQAKPPNK